jgi:hypothetical protein
MYVAYFLQRLFVGGTGAGHFEKNCCASGTYEGLRHVSSLFDLRPSTVSVPSQIGQTGEVNLVSI